MQINISEIKKALIADLEHCLFVYNKDGNWINKDPCTHLIEDLKMGNPVIMEGPLWGDILDGTLYELGFKENRREVTEEVSKLLRGGQ